MSAPASQTVVDGLVETRMDLTQARFVRQAPPT